MPPNSEELKTMLRDELAAARLQMEEQAARKKLRFDGTINLGHVMTILVLICSAIGFGFTQLRTTDRLDWRVTALETTSLKMSQVLEKLTDNQDKLIRQGLK